MVDPSKYRHYANGIPIMVSTQSTPHAPADASALDAFREWLTADLRARSVKQALVVSAVQLDEAPRIGAHESVTIVRRSPPDGSSADLELGFADGSFDAVYMHRMIRVAAPATWLGSARRVLKTGGAIVAAAVPADFAFAPLPAGGDVLLLRRVLQAAGFCRTELVCRTPRLIIVAAHRDDPDQPH
jgi:SAM-dependent methyltransferase